jgi:hypothetical protein
MATKAKKPTAEELAPAKPALTSMVKKDLQQIKDYAAALNKSIKDPSLVAIRICECCVQVS